MIDDVNKKSSSTNSNETWLAVSADHQTDTDIRNTKLKQNSLDCDTSMMDV